MSKFKRTILLTLLSIFLVSTEITKLKSMDIEIKTSENENSVPKDALIKYLTRCFSESEFKENKEQFNFEKLKYLVENGADINVSDTEQWTPILIICRCNPSLEIIKYLVENGANVKDENQEKYKPLHLICRYNPNFEIIKYLIEKGAPINATEQDGWTALHSLCRYSGNFKKISYLIEKGSSINLKNILGWTPLHLICRYYPNIETIKYLIENAANINAKTKVNQTPLHYICLQNPNFKIIKHLIINGADPYIKNSDNNTPMDLLTKGCGLKKKVEKLISHLTLSEDFLKYFNSTNYQIDYSEELDSSKTISKNSNPNKESFNSDKIWIQTRTGIDITDLKSELTEFFEKKLKEIKKNTTNQMQLLSLEKNNNALKKISPIFLEWVYSGTITNPDEKIVIEINKTKIIDETKENLVKDICKFLEINFKEKSDQLGLIKDLRKLQKDETTKDFAIEVKIENELEIEKESDESDYEENVGFEEIKVHKFLLKARSKVFREMFQSINDSSIKKVKNYSKFTKTQIKKLIDYLYNDYVDLENNVDLALALEDAIEYYQLNENCLLKFLTKDFLGEVKKILKETKKEELKLKKLKKKIEKFKGVENFELDSDSD